MKLNPIEALLLFNEKADLVHESKLAKFYSETKTLSAGIKIFGKAHEPAEPIITITEPDSEELDSVLFKLRFFVQSSDGCSYKQLKKIYSTLEISDELRDKYFKAYESWENLLNKKISIKIEKHTPKYIEVFYTFMYSKHAHSSGKYRSKYKQWEEDRYIFPYIKLEFIIAIAQILRIVDEISEINNEAIKYIT